MALSWLASGITPDQDLRAPWNIVWRDWGILTEVAFSWVEKERRQLQVARKAGAQAQGVEGL